MPLLLFHAIFSSLRAHLNISLSLFSAHAGADCPVVCTEEYAPLCTAGGMTFGNLCQLFAGRCRGKAFEPGALDIAHVGRCLPEDCPRACAKVNRKVCTSDGQTFANECELRKENCRLGLAVLAEKEGECETSPCAAVTCPANTRCVPTRQECFKEPCPQYECAPLDAEDACSTVCPANYAPVCGSDLQTYGNECELLAAACRARIGGLTEINVLHVGECTDADRAAADCAAMCPMLYAPVCGTDLNTYGNECELQAAACRARANGLAEFTVLHEGECTDADLAGSAGSAPIWQEPAFIGSMVLLAVLLVLATLAIVITVHRRRAAHAGMIRLVDMDSPATPTTVPSMIATGSTSLRDAK